MATLPSPTTALPSCQTWRSTTRLQSCSLRCVSGEGVLGRGGDGGTPAATSLRGTASLTEPNASTSSQVQILLLRRIGAVLTFRCPSRRTTRLVMELPVLLVSTFGLFDLDQLRRSRCESRNTCEELPSVLIPRWEVGAGKSTRLPLHCRLRGSQVP